MKTDQLYFGVQTDELPPLPDVREINKAELVKLKLILRMSKTKVIRLKSEGLYLELCGQEMFIRDLKDLRLLCKI